MCCVAQGDAAARDVAAWPSGIRTLSKFLQSWMRTRHEGSLLNFVSSGYMCSVSASFGSSALERNKGFAEIREAIKDFAGNVSRCTHGSRTIHARARLVSQRAA